MGTTAKVKGAQGATGGNPLLAENAAALVGGVSPADMAKTESQRESVAELLVETFGPTKAEKVDKSALKATAARERKTEALERWASAKEEIADGMRQGERSATHAGLRLGMLVTMLKNAGVVSIVQGKSSDNGKVNLRSFVQNSTEGRITYAEASRWHSIVGRILTLDAAVTFDTILESRFANMSTSALDALKGAVSRAVSQDKDAEGTPALDDVRRFLADDETVKTSDAIRNIFKAPEVKRTPKQDAEKLHKAVVSAVVRFAKLLDAHPTLDRKGYGGSIVRMGRILRGDETQRKA